ncbi:MAG: hypothetical protein ACFFD1_09605 [Candidatus Thorarchaeota archaeon]
MDIYKESGKMNLRLLKILLAISFIIVLLPSSNLIDNKMIKSEKENTSNTSIQQAQNSDFSGNDISSNSIKSTNLKLLSNPSNQTLEGNENVGQTIAYLNSSYAHPSDSLEINTTSTFVDSTNRYNDWTTDGYNNSLYYSLESPTGHIWYNSSVINPQNNTQSIGQNLNYTYQNQNLNSSYQTNFTSYKIYPTNTYLQNISFINAVNITPTIVGINFNTVGKAKGVVSYSNTNGSFVNQVFDSGYTEGVHTIYLKGLLPNSQYFFIVNGTDIFNNNIGDINNGTYYYFNTSQLADKPILQSLGISTSSNGATITANLVPSQTANLTVFYGTDFNNLNQQASNPVLGPSPSVSIVSADPSTRYFFKLLLMNSDGNFTEDTNQNNLYLFTTKPSAGATTVNSTLNFQSLNATFFTLSFTTDNFTNAQIFYGINLIQVIKTPSQTIMSVNKTSHTFLVPASQLTTTYFAIVLSNPLTNATINFNNSNSNYFSYTTKPFYTVPQNAAYINVTVQLPTYPAELGIWHLKLSITKNNTNTLVIDKILEYSIAFTLNDTLTFSPNQFLMRRGTVLNGSDIFENFVPDFNTVYSPGDNVSIVGQINYSDNHIINQSQVAISGSIDLVYGDSIFNSTGNVYTLPATSIHMFQNLTINYNNNPVYYLLNFQIPNENIYGSVTLRTNLLFPGNNSYNQVSDFSNINITVRYLLGLSNPTQTLTYYHTQKILGNVTIQAYHWNQSLFINNQYAKNNYSRLLSIPSDELNVNLVLTNSTGTKFYFFEVQNSSYKWYWYNPYIGFNIKPGSYTISYIWENNTRTNIPLITNNTVNSFTSSSPAYSYTFIIDSSFGIRDLTKDLHVAPGHSGILRFKVLVPQTNISVPINYVSSMQITPPTGVQVDQSSLAFSQVTGEYSVNVSVDSGVTIPNATLNVAISSIANLQTPQLSFIIDNNAAPSSVFKSSATVTDKNLEWTDWALLAGGAIFFVIYIGVILLFLKKRI